MLPYKYSARYKVLFLSSEMASNNVPSFKHLDDVSLESFILEAIMYGKHQTKYFYAATGKSS